MESKSVKKVIGGKEIIIETGRLAKQANGAVTVSCEGTVVLMTVVSPKEEAAKRDFLPLTIDMEERMYAAGKIPGGFIKREGRPSDAAILMARLIDRPLRPSFPKGFNSEVQVIGTILSADQINPPDILAMVGASAAISISNIPFDGPIGTVRIGYINGEWIINPTWQELERSEIDMVISGNEKGIMMLEGGCQEVEEEKIIEAFNTSWDTIQEIIVMQKELQSEINVDKREVIIEEINSEIKSKVKEYAFEKIVKLTKITSHEERVETLKKLLQELEENFGSKEDEEKVNLKQILDVVEKETIREMIVDKKIRPDGREPTELRPISSEVGLLPRAHGSGLFTRGQTQVLTALTLGALGEKQVLDGLGVEEFKRFIHHYNFPPFSTGETGRLGFPKRREIGHGALVEQALLPVIPDEAEFPYTIRLVSDILESNGSSSMASVCGSTLALMDAGVPIEAPVSGVAVGLIKEKDNYVILTDIQGVEDNYGDMDLKVAGTSKGITAIQMDLNIEGISPDILREALYQAREARLVILEKMLEVLPKTRESLSTFAPRVISMTVPQEKVRDIIGPGGKVIRDIIAETEVSIDIEDDGRVFITAKNEESAKKAEEIINQIIEPIKMENIYTGKVVRIAPFGAFIELVPNKDGLVHISKLARRRIEQVEDVVKVGDKIKVKVIDIDRMGRISLSAEGLNEYE